MKQNLIVDVTFVVARRILHVLSVCPRHHLEKERDRETAELDSSNLY